MRAGIAFAKVFLKAHDTQIKNRGIPPVFP
jgi:hypothetical protein